MVELRLQSLDAGSLPQDCYLSVRVGETQKLSKLNGIRTLRFPGGLDHRHGKIEVFKRVGACSIEVDPAASSDREFRIGCSDNVGEVGLRVQLEADPAAKQEVQDRPDETKASKMKAYKEYLGKHGLEVLLSEAMSAVLRQRPDQPLDFLVEHLKQLKPFPVVEKAVSAEKQAPADKPQEGAYYATHLLPQVEQSTMSKLYAEFSRARKPEKTAPKTAPTPLLASAAVAAAPVCMAMLPSVGTWLVSKRRAPGPINSAVPMLSPCPVASSPAAAAAAPVAAPTAAAAASPAAAAAAGVARSGPAAPWPLKPSVGTWLAVAPRSPTGALPAAASLKAGAVAKGAQSLMKGLRSGEVAQIIDAAEAEAEPAAAAGPAAVVGAGRCLVGLGPAEGATADQRAEVERVVSAALLEAGGSLAGEYFPLQASKTFAMRPGGMSDPERLTLARAGLLFEAGDADGRGVFATACGGAAVWLNASGHHVTFVAAPGGAAKLEVLEDAVNEAIRILGYTLS